RGQTDSATRTRAPPATRTTSSSASGAGGASTIASPTCATLSNGPHRRKRGAKTFKRSATRVEPPPGFCYPRANASSRRRARPVCAADRRRRRVQGGNAGTGGRAPHDHDDALPLLQPLLREG